MAEGQVLVLPLEDAPTMEVHELVLNRLDSGLCIHIFVVSAGAVTTQISDILPVCLHKPNCC